MVNKPTIGVVIVSYGNEQDMLVLLKGVQQQLGPNDKLMIVDNKKPYVLSDFLGEHHIKANVITHDNGGFAAGCNVGAKKISSEVDILLFLNPDTYMRQPDYLTRMREGHGQFDLWQSLLVMPSERLHSYGNNVHITGLTWSDKFNTELPKTRRHVTIANVCGGAMAIDVRWWKKIGGFTETYFMYFEDVDLSTRVLLAGGRLGLLEGAELGHNYSFEKGSYKWFYLERNRPMYMLMNWPTAVLVLTFLPNLAFNAVIFLQYLLNGRAGLKLRADASFLRHIPMTLRLRKQHSSLRRMSTKNFYKTLSYNMDSELLGKITDNVLVRSIMHAYYRIVGLFLI